MSDDDVFYMRYYVGHKDGDFGGVEFMEVSVITFGCCVSFVPRRTAIQPNSFPPRSFLFHRSSSCAQMVG